MNVDGMTPEESARAVVLFRRLADEIGGGNAEAAFEVAEKAMRLMQAVALRLLMEAQAEENA